jgi:glycosyltransferase involved in cell wall biosynthesis
LAAETLAAFAALRENSPGRALRLVWIGIEPADLPRSGLPEGVVQALGYLAPAEVSRWFARASLVLAPFLDGVSTRRSSFLSALAHGKAIVTTEGWATDPAVPWREFCAIGPRADFVARTVALWQDPARRARLEQAARSAHARDFSWARIAQRMLAADPLSGEDSA